MLSKLKLVWSGVHILIEERDPLCLSEFKLSAIINNMVKNYCKNYQRYGEKITA